MSNEYKEWQKDMESQVVVFEKDLHKFHGVCFNNPDFCIDSMNYEFCDFICADIELLNDNILKVQVGYEYDNYDGSWTVDYRNTLYLLKDDWLMIECDTHKVFVVDKEHISEYKKISK